MKIKNIMFSGAMASILMMGGAYADANSLTTVKFVQDGVSYAIDTAKSYTDTLSGNLVSAAGATNHIKVTDAGIADSAKAVTSDAVDGSTIQLSGGKIAVKTITDANIVDGTISQSKINGLTTALGGINTAIGTKANAATSTEASGLYKYIDDAVAGVTGEGTAFAELQSDVEGLQSVVGDEDSGLVKAVADLDESKANKADSLAGYGITDAYTKTEVNTALEGKQDKLQVTGDAANLVGSGYVFVTQDSQGKITVALDSTKITAAGDWATEWANK